MWQQLLGTMLGGGAGGAIGNMMAGGGQQPPPGQEARNVDLSGLIGALGQQQPQSGAVGLPQMMNTAYTIPQPQPSPGMVLPDREFNPNGTPPSLQGVPDPGDMSGMQDPSTWQNPGSLPINGQVQKKPVSQNATGIPNPGSPQQAAGQAQNPGWGQLLNPFGTIDNPNALVRAGVGYNQGGLIGALGYLLTDMSKQANGTSNQAF